MRLRNLKSITNKVINDDINNLDLSSAGPFKPVDGLLLGFPAMTLVLSVKAKERTEKYGPLYKYGIKILNRKDKQNGFLQKMLVVLQAPMTAELFKNFR